MSVALMSAAWDLNIPSTEKMVLLCLCDHTNEDTLLCWPSVATICQKTSKGERTVQAAIQWLVERSLIQRQMRKGTSPIYRIDPRNICAPAESAPPQVLHEPPQDLPVTPAESAPKPLRTINEPKEKKQARELSDEWMPVPFAAGSKSGAIVDGWPPGQFDEVLEGFRAHHAARGTKFKDWQAAWKTWVINSRKFDNGRKPKQHRPDNHESTRQIAERIASELSQQARAVANF